MSRKRKSDYDLTHLLAILDHKDLWIRINNIYKTNKMSIIEFPKASLQII